MQTLRDAGKAPCASLVVCKCIAAMQTLWDVGKPPGALFAYSLQFSLLICLFVKTSVSACLLHGPAFRMGHHETMMQLGLSAERAHPAEACLSSSI